MAVRIITDSTSDLPPEYQKKLDVEVAPLTVRFGKEEYLDGVTLLKQEFYQKLREAKELPTTSQVNPEQFMKIFEKYPDDEIVGIFISSDLSGTYQSAVIAKQTLGRNNIFLVDSRCSTFGLSLLIFEACRLRTMGKSAAEIAAQVNRLVPRLRFYAVVDTLKYLKMGGRLSSSTAVLGTVLHIKPIIAVEAGKIVVLGKRQGHRLAMAEMVQKVRTNPPEKGSRIFCGDSDAPEMSRKLLEAISDFADISSAVRMELGPVVGTHAGPGCYGIAYLSEN